MANKRDDGQKSGWANEMEEEELEKETKGERSFDFITVERKCVSSFVHCQKPLHIFIQRNATTK